ncbi:SNARE Ykt6 [Pyricularia oryzae Y34]|uniref:SNARE Ykt6 n=1 Tax=Pyricularia oryzae (strain Y34) TaxID=1143189 RepID=A0AA97PQS1_PYRO3|nr:SNARE Ykt6 [Pyricularia oryzae Y34]
MKLHYIGIFRNDSKPAHEIVAEKELSAYSRFTRSNYAEFMTFTSKTVAERTKARICGIIISDHAYPALVAHQLLSKVVDEFLAKHPRSAWATGSPSLPFPELKEYITTYQDPHAADSILKIQKELDETKIVLHKTIESVLQRGEKIDDLVAKSDGLSAQSKMFYTFSSQGGSIVLWPEIDLALHSKKNHPNANGQITGFQAHCDYHRTAFDGREDWQDLEMLSSESRQTQREHVNPLQSNQPFHPRRG